MKYLGDYAEDATVRLFFSTNDSSGGRVGFSATLEAADFEVIKDGATTGSTAGVTITNDFDSKTGLHLVAIDMSADAFYSTGSDYALLLYPNDETVDSQNVAAVLAEWSCENRFNEVNVTQWIGNAVTASSGNPDVNVESMDAGVVTASVVATDAIDSDALAANAVTDIQSGLATASAVTTVDTNVDSLVTAVITNAAGVDVSADVAAVKAQTDAIETDTGQIGIAGAGLSAVPWNANWDAEVESEVLDALDAQLADSIPADGTLPTLRQAMYMVTQRLFESAVSGTTLTVRKADGTTSLLTCTLDNGSAPTSITRTT